MLQLVSKTIWFSTILYALLATSPMVVAGDIVKPGINQDMLAQMKTDAAHWKLSVKEWKRYLSLMPLVKHHLDNPIPYVVLAMFPKNDDERRKYMEMMVTMEMDIAQRFSMVDTAYTQAYNKLYPDTAVSPMGGLGKSFKRSSNIGIDRRYVVFLKTKNCNDCNAFYQTLQNRLPIAAPLDVYFVGSTKNDIVQWAKKQKIDPNLLFTKQLTLNAGDDQYSVYNSPTIPSAYVYDRSTNTTRRVIP